MASTNRKRPFGKVTFSFVAIIVGLLLITITVGLTTSNQLNQVDTLQKQISALQASNNQLQTNYSDLQAQYNQLNNQYQQLKSSPSSSSNPDSQLSELQNQIADLQVKLANATTLIDKLQGQTGILPTYMNLEYQGSPAAYYLQISLKNTESAPITQIFVTLNSVKVTMAFNYLDTAVSSDNPLPAYQLATGRQNVGTITSGIGTYPLVIQALTSSGTTYTYQTTITAHV